MAILAAAVSKPVNQAAAGLMALLLLLMVMTLVVTSKPQRHARIVDVAYGILEATPPADQWLQQLPADRLATIRPRIAALIARFELAMAGILAFGIVVAWTAYALLSKKLRPAIEKMRAEPSVTPTTRSWGAPQYAVFLAAIAIGVVAHLPFIFQSIRFDEDLAALQAAKGWWLWACNFAGWQVHVASMFTIRISTAILGLNLLAIRLPAVIASTLGLAAVGGSMARRFGPWTGILAVIAVAAVPLWAEQTSLARGYGLSSAAASVLLIAVVRLFDEIERPSTGTMLLLWAAVFVGALSHFFFYFLIIGLLGCLILNRRIRGELRLALVVWIGLALLVPSLWLILGLPSTLAQSGSLHPAPMSKVASMFLFEFGFRHFGFAGSAVAACAFGVVALAIWMLPRGLRWQMVVVLLVSVGLPIALRPVWLFPRFFTHIIPIVGCVVAWAVCTRWSNRQAAAVGVSAVVLLGVLMPTRPWDPPLFVDLENARVTAVNNHRSHGQQFAIDVFVSSAVRFYEPDLKPRVINVQYPIPDDVMWLLVSSNIVPSDKLPAGFVGVQSWPGTDSAIMLLRRAVADAPKPATRDVQLPDENADPRIAPTN